MRRRNALFGYSLSATNIYRAKTSMCVIDTPPEIMPGNWQNQGMLKVFSANSKLPAIAAVLTSRIEEHQPYIFTSYFETPARLGGHRL